jgi:hypothetical protein
MGIIGGLTFIIIGLDAEVAFCIVASAIGIVVALAIGRFPPGDAVCVTFSMLDAAEQPASIAANMTTVNKCLMDHLQD